MKRKLGERIVSIILSVNLVFSNFAPFVTFAPVVNASEPLKSVVTFDSSKDNFNISVNTQDPVHYLLSYKDKTQIEAIQGTSDQSSTNFQRDIYAGTCSTGGTCVPNFVIRGIFVAEVQSQNWIVATKFSVDDGHLILGDETVRPSFDLTADETNWLNNGPDITPTPTPSTALVTPTEAVTPTPTLEATLTPTPTVVEHGQILDGASTQVLQSLPTGHVNSTVVESYACRADSLNGCLTTNQADYAPASVAIISGYGFVANTPYVLVVSTDGLSQSFNITTDSSGSFTYSYTLYNDYHALYTVELKDSVNHVIATTSFTDTDYHPDYEHWADKSPANWQNGTLQSTNSQYFEGEVVPQYWKVTSLTNGQSYGFNIYYDYRDTSGSHNNCGFDYLATYNLSRSPSINVGGSPSSDDSFPEGHGNFYVYGASINSVTGPVSSGDQRYVQVKFTANNSTAVFYWGLHLALPGAVSSCQGAHAWTGASLQTNVSDSPNIQNATDIGGGGTLQINPNAVIQGLISGYKWNDQNGNGTYDSGEPKLNGWTIKLCSDSSCNTVLQSTTTDGSGNYSFSVTPGTYYVRETLQSNWVQKAPVSGYFGPITINATNPTSTSNNFGNQISQSSPTISTTPNPSSGNIGSTLNDSATLSGGSNPTGNITFKLFSPSDPTCASSSAFTNIVSVNNGNNSYSTSSGFSNINTAGTWHWTASYSGDTYNNPASSSCSEEPVTIGKNTTSITTKLSSSSINVGTQARDSASLTGATSNASGTVTYTVYTDNACTQNGISAGTVTVTNGNIPNSNILTFNNAGDYYWQAVYSGDTNNSGVTSTCADEHLVVDKATPTLTTTALDSATVGASIYDVAHLSGGFGTLGGSITFDVFAPGDVSCSTPISVSPTKTVSGTGNYTSGNYSTSSVGTYKWIAHYSGDPNNNSVDTSCNDEDESSVTNKATPSLTTTSTDSIVVGENIHDVAHLSGGYGTLGGNISFEVFAPGDTTCSKPISVPPPQTVTGSGDYTSGDYATSTVGTYKWIAKYSGDSYNNSVITDCNDANESSSTTKASPSIATVPSSGGTVGTVISDTANVSGGYEPAGTVTFKLYNYDDLTCTGEPVFTSTSGLTSGSATSAGFTTTHVGTYNWIAIYNGDDNNNSKLSLCGDESVVITSRSPSISTTLSASQVNLGDSVHDSAILTGATSDAGGTVAYTVYTDSSCTQGAQDAGSKSVTDGIVEDSNSLGFYSAGDYYWQAVYSGDVNNNGAKSTCSEEHLVVGRGETSVDTQVLDASDNDITDSSVVLGTTTRDRATVNGQVGKTVLTGTITYDFYNNGNCTGEFPDSSETVNVDSDSTPQTLPAGSYSYQASYSGDSNYYGSTGSCEPFRINQATPTVTTTLYDSKENVITSETIDPNVHDSATVAGVETFVPTGNVDFTFYNDQYCEGNGVDAGTVALDASGVAHPSNTETITTGGYYAFRASYTGDSNYSEIVSDCEPFSVSSITIKKSTVGGDGTFGYTLEGPTSVDTKIITANNVGQSDIIFVKSGLYSLGENQQTGWILSDANCTVPNQEEASFDPRVGRFNIYAGDSVVCTYTNTAVNPELQISKTNDAGSDKGQGDLVTYTITLKDLFSSINNVVLKDLLPNGFTFQNVVSIIKTDSDLNSTDITAVVGDPHYHSPGTYNLGGMNAGDQIVITYKAQVGSVDPGLYKDIAFASGQDLLDRTVVGLAQSDGYIGDENFVGTSVSVNANLTQGGSVSLGGQVLGASTELPATGANPIWLIIASMLTGAGLIIMLSILLMKKSKVLFGAIFVLVVFGLLAASANASSLSIRLEQPKSPTSQNSFNITFTVLDLSGSASPITVQCFKKGPSDGGFSQFGANVAVSAGGNTAQCTGVSNIMNSNGVYSFYATASNGSDSATSETVNVGYNTQGDPQPPQNYQRTQVSNCQNKITFHTANDGLTVRVEVYRSDSTSFNLDGSTRVGDISIGPNQDGSFEESVPDCGKTYYYVIRSFNSSGNPSGPVGDSGVNVTNTTTSQQQGGAIPVANANLPGGPGGQVLGAKTKEEATPTAKPEVVEVKGASVTPGSVLGIATDFIVHRKKLTLLIIVVVLGLGYAIYYFVKKKNQV